MELHEITRKVSGGKLLRVSVVLEGCKIKKLKISGDFFLFPEDHLELLEQAMIGQRLESERLKKIYDNVMSDCEVIGFSRDDLIDALTEV